MRRQQGVAGRPVRRGCVEPESSLRQHLAVAQQVPQQSARPRLGLVAQHRGPGAQVLHGQHALHHAGRTLGTDRQTQVQRLGTLRYTQRSLIRQASTKCHQARQQHPLPHRQHRPVVARRHRVAQTVATGDHAVEKRVVPVVLGQAGMAVVHRTAYLAVFAGSNRLAVGQGNRGHGRQVAGGDQLAHQRRSHRDTHHLDGPHPGRLGDPGAARVDGAAGGDPDDARLAGRPTHPHGVGSERLVVRREQVPSTWLETHVAHGRARRVCAVDAAVAFQ